MDNAYQKEITLHSKKTKSERVADAVREWIRSADVPVGSRLESIRTIADKFGVTRQVVCSALEMLGREGLVRSRPGSGCFVTSPMTNKTPCRIGVFMATDGCKEDSYNALRMLNRACFKAGHDMLFIDAGAGIGIAELAGGKDGLILLGAVGKSHIAEAIKTGKPFLVFGNRTVSAEVPNLRMDIPGLLKKLFEAISEQRSILSVGAILGHTRIPVTREILLGIRELAVERGLELSDDFLFTSKNEDGYAGIESLMSYSPEERPDLIFLTPMAASGVTKYLAEKPVARKRRPFLAVIGGGSFLRDGLVFDMTVTTGYSSMATDAVQWIVSLIRADGRWPQHGARFSRSEDCSLLQKE